MRLKRKKTELIPMEKSLMTADLERAVLGGRPTIRGRVSKKVTRIKPRDGFSAVLHAVFKVLLPFILYTLVRVEFTPLAILVVLLSKWRMFAVKARHWPANIRANAVDIMVGVSTVIFMTKTHSQGLQFIWALLYGIWLIVIKPRSTVLWVGIQAMIGQLVALSALYAAFGDSNTTVLVLATTLICYMSARHFFSAFDETLGRTIAYVWAYFAAGTSWLLAHWLIFYGVVAQPTLIITIVGYSLAALYYMHYTDRLSRSLQWQFVIVLVAILLFLIVSSDWSDKAIQSSAVHVMQTFGSILLK